MQAANDVDFMVRVLGFFWNRDIQDDLFWREDNGVVSFYAKCSDFFWWGTADVEEITPENVDMLDQAWDDIRAAKPGDPFGSLSIAPLFCARVRQMRPQGAAYPKERWLWPLFDACGPERETGLVNPVLHPQYATAGDEGDLSS